MAKVLVREEWFEQVASDTLYETEYESLILQNATSLFPHFIVTQFKPLLTDGYREARPDLALIHTTYREWWIVEVELAHHSLHGHVLPQVRVFANASCGRPQAEALCAATPSLDMGRLESMMKGTPPRVMVIVNAPCPEWRPALSKYDAALSVFEIFQSTTNQFIFRINGEQPQQLAQVQSKCSPDLLTPRMLRIASPGILPIVNGEKIVLRLSNGRSTWVRIDAQDTVWLTPVGNNPLVTGKQYVLEKLESDEFSLREAREGE